MFVRMALVVLIGAGLGACEKTNHENLDKWINTESGPGKLMKAVSDEKLDADLSAHAAANLIRPPRLQQKEVLEALQQLSPERRSEVVAKLAPRLWDVARIEGEKKLPSPPQTTAKDALFALRKLADPAVRTQIDGYLVDWYGAVSYEKRADAGQHHGAVVARAIGAPMGKRLVEVLNGLIAAPGQDTEKFRIGDNLMLGIAAAGTPEGVTKLLDVARMDRGDDTLPGRAIDALAIAYSRPDGAFEVQVPDGLLPNLDAIIAIATDDRQSNKVIDGAVELIRAVGMPRCLDALVKMIPIAHQKSRFKYMAAYHALVCGGAKAIGPVVRALPENNAYWHAQVTGSISGQIAKTSPRGEVLGVLRELLNERSTVARWVAIEALAAMKSTDDKARIAALSGAPDVLVGYWGEDPDAAGKKEPTLGERAKELADKL